MMSLRGQASWAKMTSLRGKLTAQACDLNKFVNKAEQGTFVSTNIVENAFKNDTTFTYLGYLG